MLAELLSLNIFAFLLIIARVGSMMMILPGIAAGYVSLRIRMVLTAAFAFVLTPLLAANLPGMPASPWVLLALLVGEIIIGLFLGGIAVVMMGALQTAGSLIALFSSMANALIQDPLSEQQSSIIANFLTASGLLMIFVTDTHHVFFRVITDSYNFFVPGIGVEIGDIAIMVARRVADAFALGLQLSIPILIIAIIYYIGLGLLGRLMPQLPVFFFGLPIQLAVQISALMIVFSSIMMVFLTHFQDAYAPFVG